ncbi:cytochrome c peroxidase [Neolewinella xylanilytica]|uniref:Cytochrome c peroxidase n=1 Tax=Neolewinella xylanilytica TaxID=1514080 RepID=A0A2S6I235_9BACT|nr:cytochrome c peroxidase [Neolewinella xylanilytica]PPK85238.1 cytochrome c peroxidase [Neolewinella xylanilytica]
MYRYLLPYFCLLLFACEREQAGPAIDPYTFVSPEHFPPVAYDFDRNPVTEDGFKLGKRLFEDSRLSRDGSVSCSSCHQQVTAFADPQHRLSVGVEDRVGVRNAPGLFNLAFRSEYMWDGGVVHLDFAGVPAIESEVELDNSLAVIVDRLRADATYPEAFRRAFGTDTVTSGLMLQALSQYQAMLMSDRSKYDDVITGRNGAAFSATEAQGEAIFVDRCAGCHAGPLQTDNSYRNNGLDERNVADFGRETITHNPADRGKFRVPSLRNIARTPPYMHDGRLASLDAVLEHYAEGIRHSPTLDPRLEEPIRLTEQERTALIAFLETLTDWEFLADPRF